MKIINIILAIMFSLFAVVQYNDPDSWLWILFYGYIAVVSTFAIFERYDKWIIIGGLFIAGIWMVSLIPDFIHWIQMGMPTIAATMKAEAPHIELTREFLGLLISIFALLFHYQQAKKYIKKS